MNEPKFSIPVIIFSAIVLMLTIFTLLDMLLSGMRM